MELLLKRSERKKSLRRTTYDLFAKLEPTPQEETLLKKAQTEKTYLVEMDPVTATRQWRKAQLLAAVLAIALGFIGGLFTSMLLFWVVAPVAWVVLRKVIFNHIREDFSVKDLLTGRTISNNHLETIVEIENALRERAKIYSQNLKLLHTSGDAQRISLDS